ncbi:hypothetical protein PGTUg99_037723 [Puccinia graminis f. sp. tritici]|uniref:Uncharacterized protein n=1 Tax=Puccinia graminis f. sp. tritici TaxID=56615 RepID=A0A5B0R9L6_PUCGR|nr:hypothetical protein PGTUg99_037723 [Puccinia graminis f. sp. tritici]
MKNNQAKKALDPIKGTLALINKARDLTKKDPDLHKKALDLVKKAWNPLEKELSGFAKVDLHQLTRLTDICWILQAFQGGNDSEGQQMATEGTFPEDSSTERTLSDDSSDDQESGDDQSADQDSSSDEEQSTGAPEQADDTNAQGDQ